MHHHYHRRRHHHCEATRRKALCFVAVLLAFCSVFNRTSTYPLAEPRPRLAKVQQLLDLMLNRLNLKNYSDTWPVLHLNWKTSTQCLSRSLLYRGRLNRSIWHLKDNCYPAAPKQTRIASSMDRIYLAVGGPSTAHWCMTIAFSPL